MVDSAHFRRVIVIPAIKLIGRDRMWLLNTTGLRVHQAVLELGGSPRQGTRLLDMRKSRAGGAIGLFLAEITPGQIVERAPAIGDTPMRHDAIRVGLERPHEALYALTLVEGKAPV